MSQIDIARAIATIAHRGQTDKAGHPYIEHPARVAERLEQQWKGNPARHEELVAAAWLHDVLEDTDITSQDLLDAGVRQAIVDAVLALTRNTRDPKPYYDAVRSDWIAYRVKLADIADNTDPNRLALLDDATVVRLIRKYAAAREALAVGSRVLDYSVLVQA